MPREIAPAGATAAPLVPYRITICGLGELEGFAAAGVTHLVSILDPAWPEPPALAAYGPLRRVVWRFDDVIAARPLVRAPTVADVEAILAWAQGLALEVPQHLLIHCHAGVSRSTATAAILLARDHPGREAEVFATLAHLRPRSWPNSLMLRLADDLLGRGGALTAALRDHQRRVAAAHPDLAEALQHGERAHEVPGL